MVPPEADVKLLCLPDVVGQDLFVVLRVGSFNHHLYCIQPQLKEYTFELSLVDEQKCKLYVFGLSFGCITYIGGVPQRLVNHIRTLCSHCPKAVIIDHEFQIHPLYPVVVDPDLDIILKDEEGMAADVYLLVFVKGFAVDVFIILS